MKVRDVMTSEVRSAEMDTTIEEIATMMREEDVGAIPVLDDGELRGIVTDRDIVVRCIAEGLDAAEATVEEILSEELTTVEPDADVEQAARIMAEKQIRRLPVVEDGDLIGMVSLGDVAVKADVDDERVGRTLEEVSEGVKATRAGQQEPAKEMKAAKKPEGKGRKNIRQQAGAATQRTERNARVSGPRSAGVAGGGRQEALEEGGRHGRSTRGRIEAERGDVDRGIDTGRGRQGIANRGAKEEEQRQSRVVSINEKARPSQRRKAS